MLLLLLLLLLLLAAANAEVMGMSMWVRIVSNVHPQREVCTQSRQCCFCHHFRWWHQPHNATVLSGPPPGDSGYLTSPYLLVLALLLFCLCGTLTPVAAIVSRR